MKLKNLFLTLIVTFPFSHTFAKSINIMSYNVQNLFDVEHDQGKDDWTFMPVANSEKAKECEKVRVDYYKKECLETDWTANKLEIKLSHIAQVLKSVKTNPDILTLIEVENSNVIELLRKKIGYKKFVMTNSPDARGVDVALMYNPSSDLTFVSSKEHVLKVSASGIKSPTRNVLEVNFKTKEGPFTILVNHWPSQQSGPNSRSSAATQILKVLKPKLANPTSKVMLIGDFNVTDAEKPNPMDDVLLKDTGLVDLFYKLSNAEKAELPPGTFFYGWDFAWHRLDRVIVSEGFLSGAPSVKPESYQIYHPSFISRTFEQRNPERPHNGESMVVPWKYWHNSYVDAKAGFSDHYPIQVQIDL